MYSGTVDKSNYFSSPILRRSRSHGVRARKHNRNRIDADLSIIQLRILYESMNLSKFYQSLKALSHDNLKSINQKLANESSDFADIFSAYFYNKVYGKQTKKSDIKKASITFEFKNKTMDQVDIGSILHDKSINRLAPNNVQDFYPPTAYFALNKPVSLKICNYNRFLGRLNKNDLNSII